VNRHGVAGLGRVARGAVWYGLVRQQRQGSACLGMARQGGAAKAWQGWAGCRFGRTRQGAARHGSNVMVGIGQAWLGTAGCGPARQHRLGAGRHGGAWSDQLRFGMARQADIHVRVVDARDPSPKAAVGGPDRDPRYGSHIQ
jgi:hypothetical protein